MGVGSWSLGELTNSRTAMDANLASLWCYHQTIEDLKQELLSTTLELETLKSNAKEEIRKSEQAVSQMLEMLKAVTKERDESIQQLQLLLSKIKLPNCQPDSPGILQTPAVAAGGGGGGNSSNITSSDNLSNYHSYGSPPIDQSLFDAVVNSPEFSSCMNMSETRNMSSIPQQPKFLEISRVNTSNTSTYCRASASIIDSITMNKPLPEKGKLLQAVQEAGPLLQNLLLSGPLPQWRTPPSSSSTLLQPLFVPPLSSSSSVKAAPLSVTLMLDQIALPLASFPGPSTSGLIAAKRSMNSTCNFDQNSAKHQRLY